MSVQEKRPYLILVGIDFEPQSERALDAAIDLAKRMAPATVHAIHVVEPLAQANVAPFGLIDFYRDAETRLNNLLASRDFDGAVGHVHIGSPSDILSRAAQSFDADVIVLGTHGRKGVARLILGSTAEGVVRRAPCSVLVARERDRSAEALIEPKCPDCVRTAAETNGKEMWCERHRTHHPRAHRYVDNSE